MPSRVLWVATKPPWPPVDGGRLLLHTTLGAVAAAGHAITLIAPVAGRAGEAQTLTAALADCCTPRLVPTRRRSWASAVLLASLRRRPWTIERHAVAAVRRAVEEHLATQGADVVVAEQLQAVTALPADRKPPAVLRAQNVESDLWQAAAESVGGLRRQLLGAEARRLAAWEGAAVRRLDGVVALTPEDAARLTELAGDGTPVEVVPAPFVEALPQAEKRLTGDPPIVVLGSGGWAPNRVGTGWLLVEVWPRVVAARPGARLHLFADTARRELPPSVEHHAPPADSRDAFPPGAILAVPLAVASGVRMKILEAWSRSVPVVATPPAARGLGAADGEQLLLGEGVEGFAAALLRLAAEGDLRRSLVAAGRRHLADRHDPNAVAARLVDLFGDWMAR